MLARWISAFSAALAKSNDLAPAADVEFFVDALDIARKITNRLAWGGAGLG
jgi:hypothetical protein